MGIEIGRIEKEFILNAVTEQKVTIKVQGHRKEKMGIILRVEDDIIEILNQKQSWDEFEADEDIRVFFSFYGHVMTFSTKVLEVNEHIIIRYPETVYKNLQRKYVRLAPPKNVSINFKFIDEIIDVSFPRSEMLDIEDDLDIAMQFQTESIDVLIRDFRKKAEEWADTNKIQMFRERGPQSTDEHLISYTGHILYLPNMHEFPQANPFMDIKVLTEKVLDNIRNNQDLDFNFSEQDEYEFLKGKRDEGVSSELMCPLVYQGFIIGYISIQNNSERELAADLVETLSQFSKILVSSLKNHGYFKGLPLENKLNPEIIDISASGLMFNHGSKELRDRLMLYSDIEMKLLIDKRTLNVTSRVMRKYSDDKTTYYGVQFIDIKPEDFRFLFDFMYGREYSQEDEELWEGGTTPPSLEL